MSKRGWIAARCLVALLALMSCAGCGSDDVETQVQGMLDAYQRGDMAQMHAYTIAGQPNAASASERPSSAIPNAEPSDAASDFFGNNGLVVAIAKRGSFSIEKVATTGDAATITITAKVPDMVSILNQMSSSTDVQGMTSDAIQSALVRAVDSAAPVQTSFDVSAKRVNGEWLVDSSQFAFRDGMTGGLYTGYRHLAALALADMRGRIR